MLDPVFILRSVVVGNSRRRGQGAHIPDFLEELLTHLGPNFFIDILSDEHIQKIDNWYMIGT